MRIPGTSIDVAALTSTRSTPPSMKLRYKILLAIPVLLTTAAVGGFYYFEGKFFTAVENRLTVATSTEPFEFEWGSHESGGHVEPHAFQFVPVTVPGVDAALWMQLDLGHQSTVLYRKQLESLAERGADVQLVVGDGGARVEDFEFRVGSTSVKASAVGVIQLGAAIDWDNPERRRIIGTLGADWVDGHVLVSDYQSQRIQLTDAVPERLAALPMQDFSFRGRRIFLPSSIDGVPGDIWFDTGSSAFQLIVDEATARKKAKPGAKEEVYDGKSWGETIHIHNIPAEGVVRFGETSIPLETVTWIEWPSQWLGMILQFSNMGAMSGNKLFFGRTLVLDTANQRFAVSD